MLPRKKKIFIVSSQYRWTYLKSKHTIKSAFSEYVFTFYFDINEYLLTNEFYYFRKHLTILGSDIPI